MHSILISKLLEPKKWYDGRLNYTHSAAVTSMTGYVVGLGDRHLGNILLDSETSELVHIDFGVAFEQGLFLPIPEGVPFRLTRDIVNGMGTCGTEGVFRRCCEETLRVLRSNSGPLLTVLEVLLHDPLYKWKKSPIEMLKLQQERVDREIGVTTNGDASKCSGKSNITDGSDNPFGNSDDDDDDDEADEDPKSVVGPSVEANAASFNADAQRTLLRIRQKLQGFEDPNGEALSVEGQVKVLINQARDQQTLALMYEGWSAFW
jgi:phosphatidylinositol kinase/protein kinase (PI-3  family)